MIHEIQAKSLLRKQKRIDSWFLSSYGVNLYRGCTHNCVYCDGRDEKYQVEGDFGSDISVKINAIEVLERELDPSRKRKPMGNGFFFVCGGISDSYQHFEKKYNITRQTLELLHRFGHPVHMLTKSTLIERDLNLLREIDDRSRAVVSFSFSTVDAGLARLLEPGVPPPADRLDTIRRFKDAGISCGMYLMPVVPFLTDSAEMIEASVASAKEAGADFIVFGGMTLKPGRQKDYFMKFISENFPELMQRFEQLYAGSNQWGVPSGGSGFEAEKHFAAAASRFRMPKRMPPSIWAPLVTRLEMGILILEQLGYLADLKGLNNPYSRAAWTLFSSGAGVDTMSMANLKAYSGIGDFTAKLVREIIETGNCAYYDKLLME